MINVDCKNKNYFAYMRALCAGKVKENEKSTRFNKNRVLFFVLSLLSDSNQRPRDYKSRALTN